MEIKTVYIYIYLNDIITADRWIFKDMGRILGQKASQSEADIRRYGWCIYSFHTKYTFFKKVSNDLSVTDAL